MTGLDPSFVSSQKISIVLQQHGAVIVIKVSWPITVFITHFYENCERGLCRGISTTMISAKISRLTLNFRMLFRVPYEFLFLVIAIKVINKLRTLVHFDHIS